MAIVTINSLHCGNTYNIVAWGMDNNGTLVGPGSSYVNITTGVCPLATSKVLYIQLLTTVHMYIIMWKSCV